MAGATIKIAILAQAAKAKAELESLGDSARTMGDKVKAGIDSLGGLAKGAALGAGAAVGGMFVAGISGAVEQSQLNAKLAAQLGLSKDEAGRVGKIAGQVYADGFGTDIGQVNEAIKGVYQNIPGITGPALKEVSSQVLNLATVFDQDLGGTTAAVGQMIKTGLASNAKEALDILTVGFQSGADKAGDLLDTFNEYGTQFRKFGIDGKMATGLLSQGLKAGARDADLVADAIKEFSIRALDGNKATQDGFTSLGLSAKQMTADIAGGGPKAAAALDMTLDRLRAVKDPAERSRLAVALFGTQAEDLGDALFALDPSTAVAGLGQVAGAAQKAVDTMGATPAAKIEAFKRSLTQGFTEIAGGLAGFATANSSWLVPLVGTLAAIGAAIWVVNAATRAWAAAQAAITVVTNVWKAAQLALNASFLANPIFLAIAAIAALVAIVVVAYKNSETFRNVVTAAWKAVQAAIQAVVSWFTSTIPSLQNLGTSVFNGIKAVATTAFNGIKAVASGVMSGLNTLMNGHKAAASAAWSGIQAAGSAAWNGVKAVGSAAMTASNAVVNAHKTVASAAFNGIKSVATTVWAAIPGPAKSALSAVASAVTSTKSTITNAFSNAGSMLTSAGRAMIQGLINGIKEMAGRAVDAAKGVASDAVNGAKRLLGIASPSKVFREIGRQTGRGLVIGLESQANAAQAAAQSLVDIPDAAISRSQATVNLSSSAGSSSGISIQEFNFVAPAGTLDMLSDADRKRTARLLRDEILKLEGSYR